MMDEEHGKTGEVSKLNEGDWALARTETKVNKKVVVVGGVGAGWGGGAMKLKGQYSFSFVAPPFPTESPVNRVTNGHQFPLMASMEPEVLPQCRMGRTQISDEALA